MAIEDAIKKIKEETGSFATETEEFSSSGPTIEEQCILIAFLQNIANKNQENIFTYFSTMSGDPFEIISRLNKTRNAKHILNITPAQLSLLVPKLLFYKVEIDNDGNNHDIPIPFRSHSNKFSIEQITETKEGRGDDVGLKSFSYEFQGSYYAILGRSIRTKMTLFFSDISNIVSDELIESNCGTLRGTASFSDLFIRSTKGTQCEAGRLIETKLSKDYFRMKVHFGWSVPPKNELFSDELLEAIEASSMTLYLEVIKHELTFNQDGSAELNIEHIGSIEGIIDNVFTNILELSSKYEETIAGYEDKIIETNDPNRQDSPNARGGYIDSNAKEVLGIIPTTNFNNVSSRRYQYIVEEIMNKDRLYSIYIPKIKYTALKNKVDEISKLSTAILDNLEGIEKKEELEIKKEQKLLAAHEIADLTSGQVSVFRASEAPLTLEQNTDNYEIKFIFFGDILDAVLKNLYNKKINDFIKNDIVIMTGDYYKGANLADVPIALTFFAKWFNSKIIKPRRKIYNFKEFINDAVNDLLMPAINTQCWGVDNKYRLAIDIFSVPKKGNKSLFSYKNEDFVKAFATPGAALISSPSLDFNNLGTFSNNVDQIASDIAAKNPAKGRMTIDNIIDINSGNYDSLKLMSSYKPSSDQEHIVFIYTSEGLNESHYPSYENDISSGIYHFYIGKSNGVAKSFNFKQTTNKFLAESRAERDSDYLASQIVEKYSCDLEMFGNTLFKPGMIFYINPTFLGDNPNRAGSKARRIGFGGYYLVTKVRGSIDVMTFKTEVEGIWQTFGAASK